MTLSRTIICLCFSTLLLLSSCKKNNQVIPSVPVDIYIYLTQPIYSSLNSPNGWVYLTGGAKGIIVYNSGSGYKAYDRSCTYDPTTSCSSVFVTTDNITLKDSCCSGDACCKSKFIITDGGPISGLATIALVQYRTEVINGNELHIYN